MRTEDGYVIGKCLGGDSAAFGLLVDKYKESVYALAYAKLGNFHDAEDVTQEVFIKAYEKLITLRRWDRFSAWVYSITSNLCKMYFRSRSRRPDRDALTDQDEQIWINLSEQTHLHSQRIEFLHDALAELPETYRQALTLHYLSGMKIREIAYFLGTSTDTIKMRLSRARTKLRGEMTEMMNTTFSQHQLARGFTFRIVELIKQTQIQPNPPMPWLPWGISLTTGLLIVWLSFAPTSILPAPWQPLAATPIQSQTPIIERSLIPIELTEISQRGAFGSDPTKRQLAIAHTSDDEKKKVEANTSPPLADPSAENLKPIPIATAHGEQYRPQAVDDGAGGLIVVWIDERSGAGSELYAQRIDASGQPQWQAGGVCLAGKSSQNVPQLVRSGDKVMVVWQDKLLQDHAQAINRTGVVLWGEDGISVPRKVPGQANPKLLPAANGGFFIVRSYVQNDSPDCFIQHLDADGQLMGDASGVILFPRDSQRPNFDLFGTATVVSDDQGGFYFIWSYFSTDERAIVAYRFNHEINLIWESPTIVATLSATQVYPFAVSDGRGGVIVAWQQYHPQKFVFDDIYAQRVAPTGEILWQKNGVQVCDSLGTEQSLDFTPDGAGGVVGVWQDDRDVFPDIYAQRIGADGKPKWQVNGIEICTAAGHQTQPILSRSRDGQFFATWLDFRQDYGNETKTALYAQAFGLDGQSLWTKDGVPICSGGEDDLLTTFAANGTSGELKVLWTQAGDLFLRRLQ